MIDIEAYLRRIDYRGPVSPSPGVLCDLHRAHLFAVPFENLDIHLGRRLSLDEGALFEKLVARRRGGFCYEQNGLFAAVLRAIGFEVTMLSARVAKEGGGFGPDRDHLALMVRAAGEGGAPAGRPMLADVGFGDLFLAPIRLDDEGDQVDGDRLFRVALEGPSRLLVRRDPGGELEPQYLFSLEPRLRTDFEEMCLYHQTSPESHFTKKQICTRATADGRLTLSNMRFITTVSGERRERLLETEEERRAVLRDSFGIDLDA